MNYSACDGNGQPSQKVLNHT